MADPLSVAASVVAIATVALQSVQFLSTTVDNIKDAPNDVTSVRADLQAVESVLRHLHMSLQGGSSQTVRSDQIKPALENCARACTAFQSLLDHWMRHSTEEKTFWMDRWKVGLFGQDRIKAFKGQLNDYKATLSVALSTATIITTTRQEYIMKEMKDLMLQQNEAVLQQKIAQADSQTMEIERSLQQLSISGSTVLSEESEQGRLELIQEIRQQQVSNNTLRKMCDEALSRTVYERTGQKIKGVKATNHSSALTGFINTSGEESRIDQDISDITADNWSVSVAGVIKNVDFKNLRPSGPTDNIGHGQQ